jgi:hypothetical protein
MSEISDSGVEIEAQNRSDNADDDQTLQDEGPDEHHSARPAQESASVLQDHKGYQRHVNMSPLPEDFYCARKPKLNTLPSPSAPDWKDLDTEIGNALSAVLTELENDRESATRKIHHEAEQLYVQLPGGEIPSKTLDPTTPQESGGQVETSQEDGGSAQPETDQPAGHEGPQESGPDWLKGYGQTPPKDAPPHERPQPTPIENRTLSEKHRRKALQKRPYEILEGPFRQTEEGRETDF